MSTDFLSGLRAEMEKAFDPSIPQENPIRVIGLSSLILDFGMSEEELYDFVHKVAKVSLAFVHEDRAGKGAATAEAQLRFSQALTLLRDREQFKHALQDLQRFRNGERSELNEYMSLLRDRREQIDKLQTSLYKVSAEAQDLRLSTETLMRKIRAQMHAQHVSVKTPKDPARSSKLTVVPNLQAKGLLVLNFSFMTLGHRVDQREVDAYKKEYQNFSVPKGTSPRDRRALWENLQGKGRSNGAFTISLDKLFARIEKDKKTFCPPLHWNEKIGMREGGYTRFLWSGPTDEERLRNSNLKAAERWFGKNQLAGINADYRHALGQLRGILGLYNKPIVAINAYLDYIPVHDGRFKKYGEKDFYHLLGTILIEDLTKSDLNRGVMHDSYLSIKGSTISTSLHPFLVRGGLLSVAATEVLEATSDSRAGAVLSTYQQMFRKRPNLDGSTMFHTRDIIIRIKT